MKILRRILKILGIILGGIVLLLIVAALLTQTGFFKERLRIIIASAISTNINGTLHLGTIEGNFLTGFSIDSLAIYDDEGSIITTKRINFAYDILPLIRNKLSMTSLSISQPVIRITRSMDGQWNIGKLIKKGADTTATSAEWQFDFKSIKIAAGAISLHDSASLALPNHWDLPPPYFEYHNFTINDFNLDFSIQIGKNDIRTKINDLSCYSPESEFNLKRLAGKLKVVADHLQAEDIFIQTGKSLLEINAYLGDLNIFEGIRLPDLANDSVYLDIHSSTVDLKELRNFLPQVRFLNGTAYIDLEAKGKFGYFNINNLDLKTYDSDLHLKGTLSNLHRPAMISLDIAINSGRLNPRDASRLLPLFGIPSFKTARPFSISGHYTGYPVDFITNIILNGPDGQIDLAGQMNLKAVPPNYAFKFSVKSLDCDWLFNNPEFNTNLFTAGEIVGEGFTLDDITAEIIVKTDSSSIKGNSIDQMTLALHAKPKYVRGEFTASSGEAGISIDAQADFTDMDSPVYAGNLQLGSFDLSKILNDNRFESNLNINGTIGGSGKSLDRFNTVLSLNLLPSVFHGHALGPDTLNLVLDQRSHTGKILSIRSPILDADFNGLYDLKKDIPLLTERAEKLLNVIAQHTKRDTATVTQEMRIYKKSPKQQMNFNYYLNIKKLDPISALLENIPFNAQTEIRGQVSGDEDAISLTSDGIINEFFIGTTRGGVLLNSGTIHISLDSLTRNPILENFSGAIDLTADSGLINTKKIEKVKVSVSYNLSRSKTEFSCRYDSLYRFDATGTISVQPSVYVFDFDSLNITIGSSRWHNEQDVQLRLSNQGFQIMHAAFTRNNEYISLSGILNSSGSVALRSSLRNVDLSALDIFLLNSNNNQGFGGKLTADLTLTGSDSLPEISLNARCNNTTYKSTRFGNLTATVKYSNKRTDFQITARDHQKDTMPNFTLQGFIPIDLGFPLRGDRFPDRKQSVHLVSDGFNLAAIDPILKDFENLTGTLTCSLMVEGTPRRPELSGMMKFDNAQFLFLPNNINYTLNAELESSNDKILLKSCNIANQKYRNIIGTANFTGYISIRDYKVSDFDVVAKGQILLMTDATKRSMPEMFGTLLGETDEAGLSIRGTPSQPFLSGNLFVRQAYLILPPTRTSETKTSSFYTLQQIVIDDTTKTPQEEQKISGFFTTEDLSGQTQTKDIESPLIDRLRYNLNIETHGPTALTMIFTPTTGEELYAELEGKVNVVKEADNPTIYGTIEVTPRSYYNFFKRFDAKGKLRFAGQWNNPELDIEASYEAYKQVYEKTGGQTGYNGNQIPSSQPMKEQKVIVQLKITGTRYEPKLEMGMKVQLKPGDDPVDWSTQAKGGDVQSDAISFIITGKFRDELTSREAQEYTDIGSSTGTSVASSLVSSIFSDVLKKEFPFILRADLSYRGGSIQEGTSVNVTATVLTGYLRAGGKILNDIGNLNLSYQLNIGDVFKSPSIRNLYLEIQRKVEGDTPEDKKLTNEARLFYKFSF